MRYPRAPLWWGGEGGGEVLEKKGRRKVGEGERSSRVGLLLGLCLGLMACNMRPRPSFSMCFCGGKTKAGTDELVIKSAECRNNVLCRVILSQCDFSTYSGNKNTEYTWSSWRLFSLLQVYISALNPRHYQKTLRLHFISTVPSCHIWEDVCFGTPTWYQNYELKT